MKYPLLLFGLALSGCLTAQVTTSTNVEPSPASYTETGITPSFKMIAIPAGTFTMGCTSEQQDCEDDQIPTHQVTLSGFYMGETEVTQAQWYAVMGTNPSRFLGCDDCPVEQVSYEDIQIFLSKLNTQCGKLYRLPTEAEWEYAAREGGKAVMFGNGKNILDPAEANFRSNEDCKKPYSVTGTYRAKTTAVKTFKPNSLGLYDMTGNVWEWCSDWYESDYYSKSSSSNPQGASSGTNRVIRGCSWGCDPWSCRLAYRDRRTPSYHLGDKGFRLVSSQLNNVQVTTSANVESSPASYTETGIKSSFKMLAIPAGSFTMGCTSEPQDCVSDEKPTHEVTLSSFYMGETEVTQAQWYAVMGTWPSYFKDCDDCPVENVSWDDIQTFLSKLNTQCGKHYRLPTEAEWEYAAREGGNAVMFGNGRNILDPSEANFDASASYKKSYSVAGTYRKKTTPVKTFKPNSLGLYDMAGNVYEWCSDWYDDYSSNTQTNPQGASSGTDRVVRGGSWNDHPRGCRVANRDNLTPDFPYSGIGFRLASSQ